MVYRQLQVPTQVIWPADAAGIMPGKPAFVTRFLAISLDDLDGTSKLTRGMVIPCRMQKLKSVAALGEKLGPNIAKWKTTILRNSCVLHEKLALRGSLAVTWLTVYRQFHIEQLLYSFSSKSNTSAGMCNWR